MRFNRFVILVIVIIAFHSCKNENSSHQGFELAPNPCPIEEDIVYRDTLGTDSTESDFSELVNFIESKGELSRYDRLKRLDSTTENYLFLSRLLCPDEGESSAIEKYIYNGVHSFRIELSSIKPIPEMKHLDFTIYLVQYNFASGEDKNRVMATFLQSRVGWRDVRRKWKEYSIVERKKRLYIISSAFARSQETQEKYAKIIDEEWVKGN